MKTRNAQTGRVQSGTTTSVGHAGAGAAPPVTGEASSALAPGATAPPPNSRGATPTSGLRARVRRTSGAVPRAIWRRSLGLVRRSMLLRRRGLLVAAGAALFVVVLNSLVFFFSIHAVRDRDAWVNRTNMVLTQISGVMADTSTAAASARGYAISGDLSFLSPFNQARTSVTGELAQLQTLTADNPTQQQRLAQLRPLVTTLMANLQAAVALRQSGQVSQALQLTVNPYSRPSQRPIRPLLVQMQKTEQGLLQARDAEAVAAERGATVAFLLSALFDLALLAFAAILLREAMLLRERVAAEAARAESRTQMLALETANARMNEFVSIAGHELRTPLTSASLNVQMAERRLTSFISGLGVAFVRSAEVERLQALFASTSRQLRRQERLVADLLDLSRLEAGRLELRLAPCDLAAIVAETVEEERLLYSDREIILEDRSPGLSPPRGEEPLSPRRRGGEEPNPPLRAEEAARGEVPVRCDAERIRQVLMNYLTNALKYSETEQPVVVRLERLERAGADQRAARISVVDRGPGLTAEQQARVWERFYRAEGIEVRSGSGIGLGLGLYISREIVERHGGHVGIESAPGQGSTFWFTLPLAQDA